MALHFSEFAFPNMLSFANSLSFLVFTVFIPLLCALFLRFPWVLNKISRTNEDGVDEAGENTDDHNQFAAEIFRFDSEFTSFCEEVNPPSVSSAKTSKYEFVAGNSFCGYIEDPQITSFKVQELFLDSAVDSGVVEEFEGHRKAEDHEDCQGVEVDEKIEGLSCTDDLPVDQEVKGQKLVCADEPSADNQVKIEDPFTAESSMVEDFREVIDESREEKSDLDEEFPQKDEGEIKSSFRGSGHDRKDSNSIAVNLAHEEITVPLQDCIGAKSEEVKEEEELLTNEQSDEAHSPKEKSHLQFSFSFSNVSHEGSDLTNDFWHTNGKFIADFDDYYSHQGDSDEDLPMFLDRCEEDVSGSDTTGSDTDDEDDHHQDFEMEELMKQVMDEEDETEIDALLEHQSYVRKLKKEMRSLRTIGLPTILEDSESPRMEDDLKPLKITEKLGFKDHLDEVQRFYKTYSDKMKRLDVLCHQTMYAIGFLQLKNAGQVDANKKLSIPSIKTLLPHNLVPYKFFRRHESDPLHKLIRDLRNDLELVYVGQLCLSWEILKWQHAKSEELQLFDTMGLQQYSLAAGEFQQFHVLVRRFTEDEPFQLHGPRVDNYVKTRTSNSSFLQVPPVKDDSKNTQGKEMVSIVRLTDTIEESMHTFWGLVRADKKEPAHVELLDPLDAQLLSDVRTNLAKKERRIKDLVKSGNCIVKKIQKFQKIQKHQDQQLTHELLVAQVELKLIGRVIGMARLTSEQLTWCHKKLGKINILGKKVYIDSSFSLFPC